VPDAEFSIACPDGRVNYRHEFGNGSERSACSNRSPEQIELCRNLWKASLNRATHPRRSRVIDRRLQDHLSNPEDIIFFGGSKSRLDAKYRK